MRYPYVCKADAEKKYNENGFSKVELPLDADFPDVKKSDIHFYRCNLKAGRVVRPELDKDRIVLLIFNGKNSYVKYGEDTFRVTEPAFFIPDFDKQAYTVGAIEDTEFIIGVFGMNEWDRSNYKKWHKHLPFFTLYTDAVQYDQACSLDISPSAWYTLSAREPTKRVISSSTNGTTAWAIPISRWTWKAIPKNSARAISPSSMRGRIISCSPSPIKKYSTAG